VEWAEHNDGGEDRLFAHDGEVREEGFLEDIDLPRYGV